MRMMKRNEKGFTLIELMIVVAIIGILAVIAIPNFLKFQCKSKQSEAKGGLAGVFTAQKSFFSEYNTFTPDLVSLNWFPDGAPMYAFGFNANTNAATVIAGLPGLDLTRLDTTNAAVANDTGNNPRYATSKMRDTAGALLSNNNCTQATDIVDPTANAFGFVARAWADIDTDADPPACQDTLDEWIVNGQKIIESADTPLANAAFTWNDCIND